MQDHLVLSFPGGFSQQTQIGREAAALFPALKTVLDSHKLQRRFDGLWRVWGRGRLVWLRRPCKCHPSEKDMAASGMCCTLLIKTRSTNFAGPPYPAHWAVEESNLLADSKVTTQSKASITAWSSAPCEAESRRSGDLPIGSEFFRSWEEVRDSYTCL